MTLVLAHAHSDWSHDGVLTLAEWIEAARSIRCDVVLLSEHEETGWDAGRYAEYVAACRSTSTEDVRLVPGIEFLQDSCHVLCYGLQQWPPRPSTAAQLADAVHAQGCLLCLAHPGKYHWRYRPELVEAADAVEVWNSKWIYDGALGPHPRSWRLAQGKRVFVGQDVHRRRHLAGLYLETDSPGGLDDLAAGNYRIVFDGRRWTPAELRRLTWAGCAQRVRTRALQQALTAYRWTKPLRRRLSRWLAVESTARHEDARGSYTDAPR